MPHRSRLQAAAPAASRQLCRAASAAYLGVQQQGLLALQRRQHLLLDGGRDQQACDGHRARLQGSTAGPGWERRADTPAWHSLGRRERAGSRLHSCRGWPPVVGPAHPPGRCGALARPPAARWRGRWPAPAGTRGWRGSASAPQHLRPEQAAQVECRPTPSRASKRGSSSCSPPLRRASRNTRAPSSRSNAVMALRASSRLRLSRDTCCRPFTSSALPTCTHAATPSQCVRRGLAGHACTGTCAVLAAGLRPAGDAAPPHQLQCLWPLTENQRLLVRRGALQQEQPAHQGLQLGHPGARHLRCRAAAGGSRLGASRACSSGSCRLHGKEHVWQSSWTYLVAPAGNCYTARAPTRTLVTASPSGGATSAWWPPANALPATKATRNTLAAVTCNKQKYAQ